MDALVVALLALVLAGTALIERFYALCDEDKESEVVDTGDNLAGR